jgi:hypothetical protein
MLMNSGLPIGNVYKITLLQRFGRRCHWMTRGNRSIHKPVCLGLADRLPSFDVFTGCEV